MNKEKQKLIPELRFPEFENDREWRNTFLGDVAEFIDSLHETPKQYVDVGYPMVRVADVKENGLDLKGCLRVTEDIYNHFTKRYTPENGDLIFSRVGSCGETVLIDFDEKVCLGQNTVLIKAKENNFFLFFYLKSTLIQNQVRSNVVGSSHKTLSLTNTKKFDVYIPKDPKEQQKIANCLSSLDNVITAETEKLAHLKDHKKGLLQQLFPANGESKPKFRFPEFKKDGEWEETTLGEISKITTGSSNREDSTKEKGEYTFFDRSQDIRTSNRFLFDGEAIIVAGEGQEFKPKYFIGKFDLHQRAYAILEFNDNAFGKFLYYSIYKNRSYFLRYAVGSTVKSLRLPIFENMPTLIPSNSKEQQEIARCLSSADDLIATQEQKIKKLKAHKKGLMQQLFPNVNELAV